MPPIAFINPTSRVLSLTATSIIFIKPIAAPIKVIIPIAAAEPVILPKKENHIEYLQTTLELLEDVQEKSLWDLLLQNRLMKYSENNILWYYFKSTKSLSEVLVNFINSNTSILEFSINSIDEIFGEKSASLLFNDVVICQTLADDKYRNIVGNLIYVYLEFTIEEISVQKVKILIEVGTIKMTAENVKFMRIAYKPNLYTL